MAAFELDSEMLKKIDRLHKACNILNSMKKGITTSYQINDERIQINVHQNNYDFPLWSFQRRFNELTYPLLDEAIAKIIFYQSFPKI